MIMNKSVQFDTCSIYHRRGLKLNSSFVVKLLPIFLKVAISLSSMSVWNSVRHSSFSLIWYQIISGIQKSLRSKCLLTDTFLWTEPSFFLQLPRQHLTLQSWLQNPKFRSLWNYKYFLYLTVFFIGIISSMISSLRIRFEPWRTGFRSFWISFFKLSQLLV